MAELTYRGAIAAGIAQEMERDPMVVMLGEDIGAAGGVFKLTEGLLDRFGPERIRDTPISEQAIVGAAMGAAMTGLRPIAELMFSDFFAVSWDMVANQIAKTRYMTDGQVSLPLVIRTANGAGLRFGAQHSQSVENWAMAIPGLKVVAPATPADMVGLMAAAVRDPDPVIVCEHKALFAIKGDVPEGELVDELGTARIVRTGSDATVVALAAMVPRALEGRGVTFEGSDEIVVTDDYQERRITMIKGSDVFIGLPGGFGTLGEVAENLELRQADVHQKPLSLVNVNGFWDGFLSFLDHQERERFILPEHRRLVHVAATPEESLDFLDQYAPAG